MTENRINSLVVTLIKMNLIKIVTMKRTTLSIRAKNNSEFCEECLFQMFLVHWMILSLLTVFSRVFLNLVC